MKTELAGVVDVGNMLGEGVTWDARTSVLWWTDIQERKLYRLEWPTQAATKFELPERLCSFGLTDEPNRMIAAFESGFYHFWPESGKRVLIQLIEADNPCTRMNDGRLDRQGRFWAGSMVEKPFGGASHDGALYCVDRGVVSVHLKGIAISNGLAWSPNGETLYFTDTVTKTVNQYRVDTLTGELTDGREFAKTSQDAGPDGAVIDAEGRYWSAQWGSGQIVCYGQTGEINHVVQCAAPYVTCVELGGENRDFLFVTSAKEGVPEDKRESDKASGHLYIYRTDARGLEPSSYYP